MNIKTHLFLPVLVSFLLVNQLSSQSKRASQYLDLAPAPPATLAEAKSRLSADGDDIKAAALLRQIDAESDTTQPLTVDDTSSNTDNHPLSAKPAVDYTPIKKSLEAEWARLDDAIITLVQNPRLSFQNSIVAIGENRVKALAACKHAKLKKKMTRQAQDSICAAKVEADAMKKRDAAAINYLKVMRENWGQYTGLVKSYLLRQEEKLDSVRVKSVEASNDVQAKKVEATLLAVVKLVLQSSGDITKAVVEAGAR